MDVREKLVELLGNIYLPMMDGTNTVGEYTIPHKFKEKIADHLITNGVTVQKWIPVTERLPEVSMRTLVSIDDCVGVAHFTHDISGMYFFSDHAGIPLTFVTHWMPLPEPPALDE